MPALYCAVTAGLVGFGNTRACAPGHDLKDYENCGEQALIAPARRPQSRPMMRHLQWPLAGFEHSDLAKDHAPDANGTRYPIRQLRYWFAASALADCRRRLQRPLRVLEVGVGTGDMLCFLGGRRIADGRFALPEWIEQWDGLDVQVDPAVPQRYSYSHFIEADIEGDGDWHGNRSYDAIVVLHVLEHLHDPERALHRLIPLVDPGGMLMGGSPTMPSILASLHEPQLRRRNAPHMHDVRIHKHLSVITPHRIRRFCRSEKLELTLLTGAFLIRWSGSSLENSALWVRANLLWGALFPALGGEIYFSATVPR
jgi:SAM-dependent methyltransferase